MFKLPSTARSAVNFALGTAVCLMFAVNAIGQQVQLSTRDGKERSSAVRTETGLTITSSLGGTTEYVRKTQFDSADGEWLGYYSSAAQQVIRWPKSESGNLQVGTLIGAQPSYRQSLMQIVQQSQAPGANVKAEEKVFSEGANNRFRFSDLPRATPTRLDTIKGLQDYRVEPETVSFLEAEARKRGEGNTRTLRLATLSQDIRSAALLGLDDSAEGLQATAGKGHTQDWTFSDVGNGLFRIQSRKDKRLHALTATSKLGVGLAIPAADVRQLWRPIVHPRRGYVFAFESVHYPGYCLTHTGSGIYLNPFSFAPGQFWLPVNPIAPIAIQPLLRNFHTEITPNPALPPVQVKLLNRQPRAIEILLGDATNPGNARRIKIPPRGQEIVTFKRDSGSMVTEYSEVLMWNGSWRTQAFTTEIPPRQIYDVSVYEVRLQSIAIDRTGKSPSVIEDVNYQPRSIGWFAIPGGEAMHDGQSLDVFSLAQRAQNPGAVRRFSIEELENYDALESIHGNELVPAGTRRKF